MQAVPSPGERAQVLNARRELKMARSAHAYVRGSPHRFYAWLAGLTPGHIPSGPPIWICGDAHVGNLGPIGGARKGTVVELRDLDQTVIGNPAHDVLRLALSLAMAARSAALPGVTTARITEDLVEGYARAFEGAELDESIDELPRPIRVVMRRALARTRRHLLRERVGGRPRRFPLGRRFWPLDDREYGAVAALVRTQPLHHLITHLAGRSADAEVAFVDAAFWVKGCSSLGLWRVAALVDVIETSPKGRVRHTPALLDLKQAFVPSCPWADVPAPALPPAARVLAGARRLAPALGDRMVAADLLGRSVYVRELLPQDLKVELDELSASEGRAVASYLGMVVGRAHARQLGADERAAWRAEMARHRTRTLDAPSWLWRSLVELVSVHEHAYLEHCRRYALAIDRAIDAAQPVPDPAELVPAQDSPPMRSVEAAADATDAPGAPRVAGTR